MRSSPSCIFIVGVQSIEEVHCRLAEEELISPFL